jgi:hypothetical protein
MYFNVSPLETMLSSKNDLGLGLGFDLSNFDSILLRPKPNQPNPLLLIAAVKRLDLDARKKSPERH